jgi:beta-N-acetylhexosaminidase
MDSVELRPFQAAIDAGMGAVMTAHISVPGISGGDRAPATLNAAVLTDLLREDMGFDGLLFTDAMDMSAIARQYSAEEAAVLAVEAGADVILMPASPARAVDGIVAAVESGRISEQRIDASVRRLLETKEDMGLDRNRRVPLEDVYETVGIPSHTEWAAEVAERSITVLRNGRNLLPLRGTRTARVMSVSFRRASDVLAGRYFNRRLRATYPRLSTAELDRDRSPTIYQGLLREARTQALVIVSTYVTAVSYQGSMALPDEVKEMLDDGRLTAGHGRAILAADNQVAVARRVVKQGLSVRDSERIAQSAPGKTPRQKSSKSSDTIALERNISESLGLPIDIRHQGERGGHVKVAYKTLEQLDEICRRLAHLGG